MELKLVSRQEKKIAGLMIHTSFKNDRSKKEIPPLFHKVLEEKEFIKVPID